MVHQLFESSFALTCLYFSPYALFTGEAILFLGAMGLAAGGTALQFFLLREGKKARRFPLTLLGALAVFEAVWRLSRLPGAKVFKTGDDMWSCILFGAALLYVLLGAFLGWVVHLAYLKFQSRGKETS